MILWITDTMQKREKIEQMIVLSPDQLSAIAPQSPPLVLIQVTAPSEDLLIWANARTLPTLWWQPKIGIPNIHCAIHSSEYCANEFALLLNTLYHRLGVINLNHGDLENALIAYPSANVFRMENIRKYERVQGKSSLGYLVHRNKNEPMLAFEQKVKWVQQHLYVESLCCLFTAEEESTTLILFNHFPE